MTSTATGRELRLLVLGGTSWLGGEIARQAVARGHRVTCLARGEAGAAPDGVEWLRADRRRPGAYDDAAAVEWDAVVDVSWQPELVRSALRALAPRVRHWVYVSSCSVYADDSVAGQDEGAAVHEPWKGSGEAGSEEYGPAKVSCETACVQAMGADRTMVARAGLIAGYGDRSDRFGYWPARMALVDTRGADVLVPAPLSAAVQVVDVADLACWLLLCAEQRAAGTFNAVGDQVRLDEVLQACADAAGTQPRWRVADQQWLEHQQVAPWSGEESLPLWLPLPAYAGFMTRSNASARRAGLRLRPLENTIASTLRHERELGLARARSAGLSDGREASLLAALAD